jgi:hypothetical protein
VDAQVGSSCLFQHLWRWARRLVLVVVVVVLAGSLPGAGAALADPKPSPGRLKVKADRSVEVGSVKTKTSEPAQSETRWQPSPVRWPAEGTAEVAVAASGRTAVAGQPVRIGRAEGRNRQTPSATDEVPSRVTSRVLPRSRARAANVSGVLIALRRADASAAAPVSVEVDYSGFREAFGGDYARRLRLVTMPVCAAETPELEHCQAATAVPARNDLAAQALVADVEVAGADTLLAVTAQAVSPDTGTFAKSDLGASSMWAAGMQSGGFAWSYPMEVPPAPGELDPELELTYDSGRVDGRTNAESAQPSWVGEGWDYQPGLPRAAVPGVPGRRGGCDCGAGHQRHR